jgi:hypothetical protein
MYDTVNMWLEWSKVGNVNLSTITNKLNNCVEHGNKEFNSISGSLNNYKVAIFETGISLKGSICKYLNNDNLHTLTRSGMERAIIKMSDELSLPINLAKINQVDLSTHFIMKMPVSEYYQYLGDKRYFKRLQATSDTLYYNTSARQLIFYNKLKEALSKGVIIPEIYKNENLLRYEIRHKGRLNKQFNLPEVTAATLYNEKFYINLIDIWVKEYFNIQKINRLTISNMENIKTVMDAENMIFGLMLNRYGQDEIDNLIQDMKAKQVYQDPKYYSRLKSKLKQLANMPEITEKSELIIELDKEVKNIKQYYR